MLRFGTDGVRGDADTDLTPELIFALGRAIASVFGADRLLIGRDPRASGPRIEMNLAAGLAAGGAAPVRLGVLPTPGIAFSAARAGAPAAVVSASHNPWTDNGVKVIGADGRKLPEEAEAAIEAELAAGDAGSFGPIGSFTIEPDDDAGPRYVEHLDGALGGRTLDGLRVVLDCANGAAHEVGPRALEAAGARLTVLHAEPDGRNINEACGSTHPESLQRAVVEQGAALGLALDGDGDRVIAVDENGALVDGDQIIAMTALDLHARNELPGDAVVVTVMSNMGLRRALNDHGIDVVETPVGDRHVVAEMRSRGIAIGGEQSGHIIYAKHATTGDGLLTGLLIADLVVRTNQPLSELAAQMTRYPQALVGVRVGARVDLEHARDTWESVRAVEAELGDRGRVLVRASGTEPIVRIMAEATSQAVADEVVERVRRVVEVEFGVRGNS